MSSHASCSQRREFIRRDTSFPDSGKIHGPWLGCAILGLLLSFTHGFAGETGAGEGSSEKKAGEGEIAYRLTDRAPQSDTPSGSESNGTPASPVSTWRDLAPPLVPPDFSESDEVPLAPIFESPPQAPPQSPLQATPEYCPIADDCVFDEGACDPIRLFPEHSSGWQVYGWVDQGITTNPDNPANPAHRVGNLPTTFNYRNDEYMLNQLYLVMEKTLDDCDCGWDLGGRVDLLYGQDYIFTQAAGWETHDDFSNHWNTAEGGNGIGGTGMMGIAIPQLYAEVGNGPWSLKLGHFYTMIGYETVTAPDNFFYSHAFTMQYGEPFTHTGGLLTWQGDRWKLTGGIVNGWDKLDAEVDRGSFLGSAVYTPCHEQYSLTFSLISGDEDGSVGSPLYNRTMYSFVFNWQVNDRWQYVLQHDLGIQQGATADTEWYGLNQYLYYEINECWKAGLRAEWFNDDDGQRVFPGIPGHYYQTTFGLNWSPHPNVVLRPEVRYAWYDEHSDDAVPDNLRPFSGNGTPGAFGNVFNLDHQLTAAVDLILSW